MKKSIPIGIFLFIFSISLMFHSLPVRAATAGTDGPSSLSPDRIKSELTRILAEPKYGQNPAKRKNTTNELLQKLLKFLEPALKFIGRVITAIIVFLYRFRILIYILLALFVLFILYLIIRGVLNMNFKGEKKLKGETPILRSFNWKRELEMAESLVREGDVKPALSTLLNALWLWFGTARIIPFVPGRTNREYLSLLAGNDSEIIRPVVYRAEDAIYGGLPMAQTECEQLFTEVTRFIYGHKVVEGESS